MKQLVVSWVFHWNEPENKLFPQKVQPQFGKRAEDIALQNAFPSMGPALVSAPTTRLLDTRFILYGMRQLWHCFSILLCMGRLWFVLLLLLPGIAVHTHQDPMYSLRAENRLFIITLDGVRWQEVFYGADPLLINDPTCNKNIGTTKSLFWNQEPNKRRQQLMPFFWNVIAPQGKLYGNRNLGSRMNVANPYALSYPGYNELLTGRVDLSIYGNGKAINPNYTILDYLDATPMYKGKVAAFASWEAFPFILNKKRSQIDINSGLAAVEAENRHEAKTLLQALQQGATGTNATRPDELTLAACRNYVQQKKPSVVFLSFGGTDEAAHEKRYDNYLRQINNADRMIGQLWQMVQAMPEYTGKTTFLITTDHGRGAESGNWYTHGFFINGSSQTWMGLLGNSVKAAGEEARSSQLYQRNIRALMLRLLSGN